jgi:hypothetical protein
MLGIDQEEMPCDLSRGWFVQGFLLWDLVLDYRTTNPPHPSDNPLLFNCRS